MVQLQLQMLPYITGRVHVQVNPQFSNDTSKIVENARRKTTTTSPINPISPEKPFHCSSPRLTNPFLFFGLISPGLEWLASYFDPHFEKSRMCIKIPATWEGLQACEILESSGTVTLATTLFSKVQMFRAGEVGCHYIAPYVHELRVQTEPGYSPFPLPSPPLQFDLLFLQKIEASLLSICLSDISAPRHPSYPSASPPHGSTKPSPPQR